MSFSSNECKQNYEMDFYKKNRICPNCGKRMSFSIEGNFGSHLGVFSCKCGYKDSRVENYLYATNGEIAKFEKTVKGII